MTKNLSQSDPAFINAVNLITLYCFLFALFGTIEFLIMFSGATMFCNATNLVQITIHVFGEFTLL